MWRLSSKFTCYIWSEENGSVGVYPPGLYNPMWRVWLERQDARKRFFIQEPPPGFWRLSQELMPSLQRRCIELSWVVYNRKPSFLLNSSPQKRDAFEVFFLLPTAPKEVVDAAYRALIKRCHTDVGGDGEMAVRYNNARDEIYKQKGW